MPRARLADFLALCRRWLKPGGRMAFIDSRRDRESSAIDHPQPENDMSVRKLDDGQTFNIVKVYWQPEELERALLATGFASAQVITTPRFFLMGEAVAG